MKTRNSSKESWRNRISDALELGRFISWKEGSIFLDELEAVHRPLVAFSKRRPGEALEYFEIFIGGCLVKGNEVDDSGGELGLFLDELFESWARCCAAAKVQSSEFLRKLAHWIKADDIGFCHDLEEKIIPAMSAEYRNALRETLEKRLQENSLPAKSERERDNQSWHYRSSLATLKKLLITTDNTTALIQVGERHGFTAEDCLSLATTFSSRGRTEKALEWAERGLKCSGQKGFHVHNLDRLKRKLLTKMGRRGDAVQDAWKKFEEFPSIYTFKDVLACAARGDKTEFTDKALTLFDKANLQHAAEALYELGKIDRLVERIDRTKDAELKEIFYSTSVSIAKSISKSFPHQAARLYITQALVILDERRSKAYHHAHDYLHAAKSLLERAGKSDSWLKVVTEIRQKHRQKSGFMPGFESINDCNFFHPNPVSCTAL